MASALLCPPPPKIPVICSPSDGSCFSPDISISPITSNKCVGLFTKFTSENVTNKDLYLRFFNADTNQTIQNVSFFINMTKQGKMLGYDLFYTHSGSFTIKFQSDMMGNWTVFGERDPVLGGLTSPNDTVVIDSSAFTNVDLYHIHTEVFATDHAIVNQTNTPKFDFWWSADDKGDISKYDNNTIEKSFDIGKRPIVDKIQSPLKQLLKDDGIFGYEVKCNQGLAVVIKKLDNSPACVKPDTAKKLVERGWGVSSVNAVWFEFDEFNGIKPPWDSYSGGMGMPHSQGYYVQNYFKEHAITILDAKLLFAFSNGAKIFFLVSQDDADEMVKLGFKPMSIPPNTYSCSSINGC